MSARTPFIPSVSRPASRSAHHKDSASANAAQDAQFSPVVSNPLHASSLQLSSNKSSASSEIDSSSSNNTHKPLNVIGLFKKPSGSGSHSLTMSARKGNPNQIEKANSGNDSSTLSALTKARSIRRDKAGTPSVLAPKPLNAVSVSELLSSSSSNSFKTPPTPVSSAVTSLHATTETHIPISDDNSHPHQYKFGNAPPQRIMLHDEQARAILPGLIPKHTHRDHASKKRGRAELEADDDLRESDLMYSNRMDPVPAKRYKSNTLESDYAGDKKNEVFIDEDIDSLRRRSFTPQLLSSPIDRPGSRHSHQIDYRQQNSPSEYHTSPGQGFHPHDDKRRNPHQQMFRELIGPGPSGRGGRMGPTSMSNGSNDVVKGGATLDKLLGCQVDIYVDDHMKKYDQLTKKWKDGTLEEWLKGSDEMMAKYSKILDFVKNHMSSKLKLFTTFEQRINAHNTVLNERAKLLEDVKGNLVTQSGNILG